MRPRLSVLLSVALLTAACAGDGAGDPEAPEQSNAPAAAPSTTSSTTEAVGDAPPTTEGAVASSTEATRPDPDPDRPLAPDFQLTLSTGDSYQLSADTKPVFVVFWAEW